MSYVRQFLVTLSLPALLLAACGTPNAEHHAATDDGEPIELPAPSAKKAQLGTGPFYVTSTLSVTVTGWHDEGGENAAYEYRWYVNGKAVAKATKASFADGFRKNDTVFCRVIPKAGEREGEPIDSNKIVIANSLPSVGSVSVDAGPSFEASTLSATVSSWNDADADAPAYIYQWYVNGVAVAGAVSSSLSGADFDKGDSVFVRVTPDDQDANGSHLGTPVDSNAVVIFNSPPSMSSVTLDTGPHTELGTITIASLGGWSDADPADSTPDYHYQWQLDAGTTGAWVDISGATGATLGGANFNRGDSVRLRVSPFDGTADGAPVTSNEVTVANSPPTMSAVTIATGPFDESGILSVVTLAGWADADPADTTPAYQYQWQIDAGTTGAWADIAGAVGTTLTGSSFNRGDSVRLRVSPTDGLDAGAAVTSNEVTIVDAPPSIASAPLNAGPFHTNSVITVTPTGWSDADGDAPGYSYAWFIDGVLYASATTSTITGAAFSKGVTVQTRVTPNDGLITGAAVWSNIASIANSAPSISGANLNGSTFTEVSTITVSPAGWTDADGDAAGYRYQWYVNNSAVTGETAASLTGAKFAKHDSVFVRVTPDDQDASGNNLGAPLDSATVTIANTPPTMSAVTIATGPFDETGTVNITALAGWADADPADATPAYQYQWQIDAGTTGAWADIAGATGTTLTGASFNRGDSVRLRVSPTDGEDTGSPVLSNAVAIVNAPPSASAVTVSTAPFYTNDVITAWVSGWSDADGDAAGYDYQWYRNGWAVTGATLATLSGVSGFDKHDSVFVRATPNDGQAANNLGTPINSSAVVIQNSLPALASATLSGPYRTNDAVTIASYGTWTDADGDTAGYHYQWYVDAGGLGSPLPVAGQTGASLDGMYFDAGDQVYVQVIPYDGEAEGLAVDSNAVTIANTPPTLTGVAIDAGTYYVDTPITAGAFGASDADGDATSYVYRWYVNGVSTSVSNTNTLATGNYAKGQTVSVLAFATDGLGASGFVTSSSITIQNRAPTINSVSLGAGPFVSGVTLTTTVSDSDLDGDTLTRQYRWYVNGVSTAVTAASLPSTYFTRNDTVFVRAWTTDGASTSAPADSATVTIANAPPGAPGITLLPGYFTPGENLEVLVSTPSTDADGDTVTYSYAWYKNGSYQGSLGNVSKVPAAQIANGDTWQVYVTPNDGATNGPAANASISTRIPNEWTVMSSTGAPQARWLPAAVWTGSQLVVWAGTDNGGSNLNTGGRYNPVTDSWLATQTSGAPTARRYTVAVWSGSEMIVWGGIDAGGASNTGGRYNPATDAWSAITTNNAPSARYNHSAVWTGKQMIVWGAGTNTGGRYDPVGDVWYATSTTNAPTSRSSEWAVWTGTEMIVWGGSASGYTNTGGRYNPNTDTWVATSTSGAPSGRTGHKAVWTGKEMIIWGDGAATNTGGRYNPITDSWTAMSTTNAPDGRYDHAMDWTGNEVIVWGGTNGFNRPMTCGRYNPETDTWSSISAVAGGRDGHIGRWTGYEFLIWGGYDGTYQIIGLRNSQPVRGNDTWTSMSATTMAARTGASIVWTGSQALIWGGKDGGGYYGDGQRYTPSTDTWAPIAVTGAPSARSGHAAVWTGSEMVVWGGTNGTPLADGMRYDPALDTWSSAIAATSLAARSEHSAVWTGKTMIVWGGTNGTAQSDGDSYDPALDTWTGALASAGLSGRTQHTALFTGAAMIIWGGTDGSALGDGAVYDVNAGTWSAMAAAPISARYRHGSAWSGKKMVVWGGTDGAGYKSDGATYDPAANKWTTISSPYLSARADHVMVWTGDDVLIWGGLGASGALADGRRYDVLKDTWSSLAGAGLSARASAMAVNTGTSRLGGKTLVWGGTDGAGAYFNDGVSYAR